ncbi:MAG: B12-binding domain-containing radical SAM protein [Deltaproteobacteria bacterium]|nr:B12-binding domain-containing radical SAM protein [Deltaproteobacteria bacterium]
MNQCDVLMVVPYQEIAAFGPRIIDNYLRSLGHRVDLVFFKGRNQEDAYPSKREISLLVDFVRERRPYLVGFSVMSAFYNVTAMLTERIRNAVPVPIVWGGVHPTICPEECITVADLCCLGEGEEPLRRIVEDLKAGGEIGDHVQNCWIRKGDRIVKNEVTYLCKDPDDAPIHPFTHENKYFIEDDMLRNEDPYITYIERQAKYYFKAFRGCPFHCTYCGNKAIRDVYGKAGNYLRRRSLESVMEELNAVLKQFPGIKKIHSYDEVFISDREFVREFSKRYKKEIGLPFSCDIYLSLITPEIAGWMSDAGLYAVNVGIEAFSEEIRRDLYRRKGLSNANILEKAGILKGHGVRITYDFIWDNPVETEDMIEKCFWDLIRKLPRPCNFNHYSLSFLPKSELAEMFLKKELIRESDIVGHSDKGLVQWKVSSKYRRSKRARFWHTLFRLTSLETAGSGKGGIVPMWIIEAVAAIKSHLLASMLLQGALAVQSMREGNFLRKVRGKVSRARKKAEPGGGSAERP